MAQRRCAAWLHTRSYPGMTIQPRDSGAFKQGFHSSH